LRIGNISVAILQYVDDAVLLPRSPEELQHMIHVIAQYCSENRLTLNPREGKTEIVEFLCAPSGMQYTVVSPTKEDEKSTATIHVEKGYQYLGWWIDSHLRLDEHTDKIARLLTGAAARGQHGGHSRRAPDTNNIPAVVIAVLITRAWNIGSPQHPASQQAPKEDE
jgi:hypothetical protein